MEWFAGTTSRPRCGPWVSRVAWPGPVAYQRQFGSLAWAVISRGADHVAPSSSLYWTNTRRPSCAGTWPRRICVSDAVPALYVVSSTIRPPAVTTGAGLPEVFGPLSWTTRSGPHVQPPSVDRFTTVSMFPASPSPSDRPSANASRSPDRVVTTAGMRNALYPSVFAVYGTDDAHPAGASA